MAEANGEDTPLHSVINTLLSVMTDPDRVSRILAVISDPAKPPSQLADLIPSSALRLAMAVASQPHFQSLADSNPDVAEQLTAVRERVLASFPGIALSSVAFPSAGLEESREDGPNEFLCRLAAVEHAKVWFGDPPTLAPAVQLVVTDEEGDHVLDQVLDWDDLLFLAESTLSVLKESVGAGATLVKAEAIAEFLESLPEKSVAITALLQELGDAAATYKR